MKRHDPLNRLVHALAGCGLLAACLPAGAQAAADKVEDKQTIVVTAQKRTQNIREVPVAVSVVGAEQIEKAGVRDIYDLAKVAPSLDFGDPGTGGAGGSASIRGIGTAVFTTSAESSVGVVVDGVPLGNTASSALFDLERVEVLRGPQGTLFGKSASAGVLNMVTKAPVLKRFEGFASAEVSSGTAKNLTVRAAVNAPLGETAALRATLHSDRLTGVVKNLAIGKDSETTGEGARVRLLLRPSADLNVSLIAEHDTTTSRHAAFFVPAIAYASNTAGNHAPLAEFAACGVTVSTNNNQTCGDVGDYVKNQVQGLSGQIDWTLQNGLTFTSITAWRERTLGPSNTAIDMQSAYDKIRATDDRKQRQITQELRLASPSKSAVEWTAGLFYADYDASKVSSTTITPPPFAPSPPVPRLIYTPTTANTQISSTALFGQATFKLSNAMGLIAGLRYTRDKVADQVSQTSNVSFAAFSLPPSTKTAAAEVTQTNLSGKLGLQYALDATTNGYITLTRGYKAPQIDNDTAITKSVTTGNVVAAEEPTNLEVGLKTSMMNRKVDLDVAVFHNKIKNFQEQACTLTAIGALSCIPLNVPSVTSQGVEIDLRVRPAAGLTLSAAGALVLGTEYPAGYMYDGSNVGGQRLLYTPKAKLVLGAEYFTTVMGGWGWTSGVDVTYKSRVRYCNTLAPECSYKEHGIVGLRTGINSPSDKFDLTLSVRNATDERVPAAILYPLPGKGAGSGYAYLLTPNSFRSVGLTGNYRF